MFETLHFIIPTINETRTVTIYFPYNYSTTTDSYPVIYMHDAQNLFQDSTAYGGESWRIQKYLNQRDTPQAIVVAIDNSSARFSEYSPFPISAYGKQLTDQFDIQDPLGIVYIDWIVHELKPMIDKTYRTLSDPKNTTIAGSSMGGYISFYAGIAYPDIFSNLAILSPAFWFNKVAITHYLTTHPLPHTSKIYMSVGTHEGGGIATDTDYLVDAIEINKLLARQACHNTFTIIPDGIHHESAWEKLTTQWSNFFGLSY